MAAEPANSLSPRETASGGGIRLGALVLILVALLPLWRVLDLTADARRDVVYWDEFDTALALALKLDSRPPVGEIARELLSLNNEHRMVLSRLIFATSYWLTGGIDFVALDWIGNLAIVAACLALVLHVRAPRQRLLLGLLLAAFVFQLGNYENLVWSGASIDHFVVILFALLAALALSAAGTSRLAGAIAAGLAASFTLAHGLAIWPAGAVLLAVQRRHRDLLFWLAAGAVATTLFLAGFRMNAGHAGPVFSLEQAGRVLLYWLSLLGSTPSLGHAVAAPFAGAALVTLSALLLRRRGARDYPVAYILLLFLGLAGAMIALGRAEHAKGVVYSRYQIISAMAWAVALWLAVERAGLLRRPWLVLPASAALLLAFNFAANRSHHAALDSWITCRDLAVNHYFEHGEDGRGAFTLHPIPAHATSLLHEARRRGIYSLEPVCRPEDASPRAVESGRITYHLETVQADADRTIVKGWAGIDGEAFARGAIRVILRAGNTRRLFTAVSVPREDVPRVMGRPEWRNAGFFLALPTADVPAGEHQVGLLVRAGGRDEFVMTASTLAVPAAAPRAAD